MRPESYRVTRDREIRGDVFARAGDVVYRYAGYDYGLASDDTFYEDMEHISVTKDPAGGGPFFTIPRRHLEALGGE